MVSSTLGGIISPTPSTAICKQFLLLSRSRERVRALLKTVRGLSYPVRENLLLTMLVPQKPAGSLLKVWSSDQGQQPGRTRAYQKHRTSAPIPDLLNQNPHFNKLPKGLPCILRCERHQSTGSISPLQPTCHDLSSPPATRLGITHVPTLPSPYQALSCPGPLQWLGPLPECVSPRCV